MPQWDSSVHKKLMNGFNEFWEDEPFRGMFRIWIQGSFCVYFIIYIDHLETTFENFWRW